MSKTIQQISIFVENTKGRMAEITDVIGKAGIDIRALSVADTSDFGILRLIVNNPEGAIVALRDAGIMVSITEVLAVGIQDEPGSFSKIVSLISANDINIEYMYAFISRSDSRAFVIMRVDEVEQAITVLEQENIYLLKREEVYNF